MVMLFSSLLTADLMACRRVQRPHWVTAFPDET